MKIYAKQIPPEYQESPLQYGDWPDKVYVFGNKRLTGHGAADVEKILDGINDAGWELREIMIGCGHYDSFIDIINDLLPAPEYKKEYSRADRLRWRSLLLAYDNNAIRDDDATTAALELITGEKYASAEIRGCCQGDWQNIIYPEEYGRDWLRAFEIEYFNLGAEWQIIYDDPGNDPDFCMYTYDWSDDGRRAEIADAAGCTPDDVILLEFDGWSKTAVYKAI